MTPETAAELIGRLTAKCQTFEPALAAFGGHTPHDVAAALALVKSIPGRLLVRMKYSGEEVRYTGSMLDLVCSAIERGALFEVVSDLAMKDPTRWKAPRTDFIRDMCRLALVEVIHPSLCPYCRGRGFRRSRKNNNLPVKCSRCEGTGAWNYKDADRAHVLHVEPSAWAHSWRDRYNAIRTLIANYEPIALRAVAKRLR